ncbi:sulfatase family protein [Nocardioides sp. AX2bis]|uniref:sulfatase family protein n=1 Tax=Nocardioides sp. AX2bis TaxID=2653157 RepID=UPI0012EFD1BE|nr:sulfatase [Nocardioides sp. AX2bis]VXB21609.1 Arylsulfatase A [Nocardioides sp. AX2bis]
MPLISSWNRTARPRRTGSALALLAGVALAVPLVLAAGTPPTTALPAPRVPATASATAPTDGAATPALRGRKPNVVMIMSDDMRADDLAFAPRISRLVGQRGLTFANSFSPYPLCCPARASFLTGQYTHNHGVYKVTDPFGYQSFDDSRTLATSLRDAGYETGFVGKYLNGYGKDRSLVSGELSYDYVPQGWTDWRAAIENPGRAQYEGPRLRGGTYHYFRTPFNLNGRVDTSTDGEYQTDTVGDMSVDMARGFHRRDRPFFMNVNYVAPHHGRPSEPDDPSAVTDQDGVYDGFSTPARPDWVRGMFDAEITHASGMPADGGPAEADVSDKPPFFSRLPELTTAEREALTIVTRQRAESIYVMDQQVGRLINTLKRTGEWSNTVFMFSSDNGYFLGEHRQRTGKSKSHEPSLRVPFLVTGPGLRTGETRYDPVTTVDATATILDAAGARPPVRPDGRSLLPTMTDGDRGWDVPVVTESAATLAVVQPELPENPDGDPRTAEVPTERDPDDLPTVRAAARPGPQQRDAAADRFDSRKPLTSVGLRTARFSFTLYRDGEGELYDLLRDPAQLENVFDDPGYAEEQAALARDWDRFASCSGGRCRDRLDPALRADAEQTRALGEAYWSAIGAIYGRTGLLPAG